MVFWDVTVQSEKYSKQIIQNFNKKLFLRLFCVQHSFCNSFFLGWTPWFPMETKLIV